MKRICLTLVTALLLVSAVSGESVAPAGAEDAFMDAVRAYNRGLGTADDPFVYTVGLNTNYGCYWEFEEGCRQYGYTNEFGDSRNHGLLLDTFPVQWRSPHSPAGRDRVCHLYGYNKTFDHPIKSASWTATNVVTGGSSTFYYTVIDETPLGHALPLNAPSIATGGIVVCLALGFVTVGQRRKR